MISLSYVDSSALTKLVVDEAESPGMLRWFVESERLACSRLGVIETRRAAARNGSDPGQLDRVLRSFTDGGRQQAANHTVGGTVRPIGLSRTHALFAGADGGDEHWATVASRIETCKLNDIDPLAYLTDVLTRIVNGHPNRDIGQLLPLAYLKQDLKAVA